MNFAHNFVHIFKTLFRRFLFLMPLVFIATTRSSCYKSKVISFKTMQTLMKLIVETQRIRHSDF